MENYSYKSDKNNWVWSFEKAKFLIAFISGFALEMEILGTVLECKVWNNSLEAR